MGLEEPIAAYNAATNVEAQLVKVLLNDAGVEAFVSEDLSVGGYWMFGNLPEIHKPQVWISARDRSRAQQVLTEYEQQVAERNRAREQVAAAGGAEIEVICEECGEKSSFPAEEFGSVQNCPHCGAHVDVGEVDDEDQYWMVDEDGPGDSDSKREEAED